MELSKRDREEEANLQEKVKCWEVTYYQGGEFQGKYITEEVVPDISELEGCEVGDKYALKKIYMTRGRLNALKEFDGF